MELVLQALMNPTEMTRQQWMLVGMLVLVLFGVLFFVWKLYKIIEGSRQSTYVPNIGRKRLAAEKASRTGQVDVPAELKKASLGAATEGTAEETVGEAVEEESVKSKADSK